MKLLGSLFALLMILGIGSLLYIGLADIEIPQQTKTLDITPQN